MTAFDEAHRLGLHGWVRNRMDGRVEALVEGERPAVEEFIAWCGHGPRFARVIHVQVDWEEPRNDRARFEVR